MEPGCDRVERSGEPSRRRVLERGRLARGGELLEQRRSALAGKRQRVGKTTGERDQVGPAQEGEDSGNPFTDVSARPFREEPIPPRRLARYSHVTQYRRVGRPTLQRDERRDVVNSPKATRYRWEDMPKEQLKPDLGRRLISTERLMLAHVYLEKGCVVPKHSHENEQLTYILEGLLRFSLGDDESEVVDVAAGEVLHIPSNLPHKAEAIETTLDVDIFCPPRQDWLDGSDAYLRRT